MFKISHPNPSFIINNHIFATQEDAEAHMKLIRKYVKEWTDSGLVDTDDTNRYLSGFKIEAAA